MGFWWKKKIILIFFFLITKFLDQLIILSLDYEFKIKLKLCTTKIAHWWKKTVEYIFFIFLYYEVVHLILYQNLVLRQ